MQDTTFGYTNGEVHALVAPLIGVQPDDIEQIVILAAVNDGMIMKGTELAPQVIGAFIIANLEETARIHGQDDE